MMPLPRRPSGFVRYVLVALFVLCALYAFNQNGYDVRNSPFTRTSKSPQEPLVADGDVAKPQLSHTESTAAETPKQSSPTTKLTDSAAVETPVASKPHTIDGLIFDAQNVFAELITKESKTVAEAAQAYRKRRGRHPPPGFDKWFEFAGSVNALVVEDFFDQVYHDLAPFWGMEPALLRRESWDFEMTINVRNGTAAARSDWFWTKIWLNMTKSIEQYLPDMDLPLNAMDEPRLVAPWEEVNEFMQKGSTSISLIKPASVISKFSELPSPGKGDPDVEPRPKNWQGTNPYWRLVREGCPPDSLARTVDLQKSFEGPPNITLDYTKEHSPNGYVSNFTLSTYLCHQPDLQGLEGVLIHPISTKTSKVLAPLFAGSKLSVSNEILLPAPMYWNEEERFTGGNDHGISWAEKHNTVMWRGVATGGTNLAENWRGFQRHRFVAMNNGTKITRIERGEEQAENFVLPDQSYSVQTQKKNSMGEWVQEFANVSFVDLFCQPKEDKGRCSYTGHYFHPTKGIPMAKQFDHKYVPDLDGNSFSGRYLGFLRSTSLPIKSTIFREWHDSRLVAWKHFVPMDNRFGDYYGIMEYFLGTKGKNGHDQAAQKIATEGKEWAEKVLRKEDMQVYVLRLLLEYARILDDKRENMGWVDDVLENPSLEEIWKSWW